MSAVWATAAAMTMTVTATQTMLRSSSTVKSSVDISQNLHHSMCVCVAFMSLLLCPRQIDGIPRTINLCSHTTKKMKIQMNSVECAHTSFEWMSIRWCLSTKNVIFIRCWVWGECETIYRSLFVKHMFQFEEILYDFVRRMASHTPRRTSTHGWIEDYTRRSYVRSKWTVQVIFLVCLFLARRQYVRSLLVVTAVTETFQFTRAWLK